MIDKIIYTAFTLFGAFFMINSIPLLSKGSTAGGIGPGVIPFVLSVLMCIFAILQMFKKSEEYPHLEYRESAIIGGVIFLSIMIWIFVDFYATLPILIFVLMYIFKIFTWKSYLIFASVFIGIVYSLFSLLLKVNL